METYETSLLSTESDLYIDLSALYFWIQLTDRLARVRADPITRCGTTCPHRPAAAVYFNYVNTTVPKNFWSWFSWYHFISLERCGHYCIYFYVLRNSVVTMREIVAGLSDDTTFNNAIVHAFVCRFTSEWIKCWNDFLLFVCCTRMRSDTFSVTLNFESVMKRANTDT